MFILLIFLIPLLSAQSYGLYSGYRACSTSYCPKSSGCCIYGYYETSADYSCSSIYCNCASSSYYCSSNTSSLYSGYRACSSSSCSTGCCSYGYLETSSDYSCSSSACSCVSASNCGSSSYGLHTGYRSCSSSSCSTGCCSYGYYETSSDYYCTSEYCTCSPSSHCYSNPGENGGVNGKTYYHVNYQLWKAWVAIGSVFSGMWFILDVVLIYYRFFKRTKKFDNLNK